MDKVLVITYYWPPSGGSGVQRWMYFCKYLPEFGIEPHVITVDPKQASYKFTDKSFMEKVKHIKSYPTRTIEPLKIYSKILSGNYKEAIPGGFAGEGKPGLFQKISRYIRGNYFIPDARKGWVPFAFAEAKRVIEKEGISVVITTGPPHSSHLVGQKLKKELGIKWMADFRDPWTELYYNKFLYRKASTIRKDIALEKSVLEEADKILTVGPGLQKLLTQKIFSSKDKTSFVYNGFDEELFQSLKQKKNKEEFIITHIGILGDSQPITGFLQACAQLLRDKPEREKFILLKVVGKISPSLLSEIKMTVPSLRLEILEYVPHQEAIQIMINSDLLLSSLAETEFSKLLISGKLMEYMASGNPILCLGDTDGDAASLLHKMQNAKVFLRSDVKGISTFLHKTLEDWSSGIQTIYPNPLAQKYSRRATSAEVADLIKQLFL